MPCHYQRGTVQQLGDQFARVQQLGSQHTWPPCDCCPSCAVPQWVHVVMLHTSWLVIVQGLQVPSCYVQHSGVPFVLVGTCWVSLLPSKHTRIVAHAALCRAIVDLSARVGYTFLQRAFLGTFEKFVKVFFRWCLWIKAQLAVFVWDCYADWLVAWMVTALAFSMVA